MRPRNAITEGRFALRAAFLAASLWACSDPFALVVGPDAAGSVDAAKDYGVVGISISSPSGGSDAADGDSSDATVADSAGDGRLDGGEAGVTAEAGPEASTGGPGNTVPSCAAGGDCTPASECQTGTWACDGGTRFCQTTGTVSAGTACDLGGDGGGGGAHVCSTGACVPCNAGGDCSDPSAPCIAKSYDCSSGAAVCKVTGNVTDGTHCGDAGLLYCNGGVCSACSVGSSCTPAGNPCHVGKVTACTGGVPTCADQGTNASAGTSCTPAGGASSVCDGSVACVACSPNAQCSPPGNPCMVGVQSCSAGPVCTSLTNVREAQPCGTSGEICHAGACVACNASSCAGGCCDSNGCVTTGQSTAECGNGASGGACEKCPGPTASNGAVTCSNNACGIACTAPTRLLCNGACVDPTLDPNCGACGRSCTASSPGTVCGGASGQCVCNTTSGCGGCCSSASTCEPYASESPVSCGAGGGACVGCGPNQVCDTNPADTRAGACLCDSSFPKNCNGVCVNPLTDPNNCGSCGTTCPISCNSGTCLKATSISTSANGSTSCAVLSDGTVRCWGANGFGQAGSANTSAPVVTPFQVPGLSNATAVSVALDHACAVAGGTISCWGAAGSQLGIGSPGCTASPCPASPIMNLTGVLSVSANASAGQGFFTCALVPGGLVYCWGGGSQGQLADGITGESFTPTLTNLNRVSAIATLMLGGCALISDGTVVCWGSNNVGEAGNGTTNGPLLNPAQVPGLSGVTALFGGTATVCALLTGGTLECWGNNESNNTGTGSNAAGIVSPTPVIGLNGLTVTSVAPGAGQTCALISDGTVRCWGPVGSVVLGNGVATTTTAPVQVSGLTNAIQITSGSDFSCALLSNGAVQCWGTNGFGELGMGVTSANPQPTPVLVQW